MNNPFWKPDHFAAPYTDTSSFERYVAPIPLDLLDRKTSITGIDVDTDSKASKKDIFNPDSPSDANFKNAPFNSSVVQAYLALLDLLPPTTQRGPTAQPDKLTLRIPYDVSLWGQNPGCVNGPESSAGIDVSVIADADGQAAIIDFDGTSYFLFRGTQILGDHVDWYAESTLYTLSSTPLEAAGIPPSEDLAFYTCAVSIGIVQNTEPAAAALNLFLALQIPRTTP